MLLALTESVYCGVWSRMLRPQIENEDLAWGSWRNDVTVVKQSDSLKTFANVV